MFYHRIMRSDGADFSFATKGGTDETDDYLPGIGEIELCSTVKLLIDDLYR